MGASQAPVTPGSLYQLGAIAPTIEYMASLAGYTIVGDWNGTTGTDNSAAIIAAHAEAVSLGIREVYCGHQYYAPSAWNIGQVLWRGPGAFIGTYRTRVVPYSARGATGRFNTIVPSVHLARAAKALVPTVVILSDSTGTYAANHVNIEEMIWPRLQKAFKRDNPGRSFNFVNRAIGGTAITNYSSTGYSMQGALAISSITWSGNVATVTTAAPHGLTGTQSLIIESTTPTAYSSFPGAFSCTITGASTFTYNLVGNPGNCTIPGYYAVNGGAITLPSWFANPAAPWSGYISNQTPDLVIVNFGQNGPTSTTPYQIGQLVASLQAYPKVPDILFLTNTTRSTQADSGSAEQTALEQRDQAGGSTRSYAAFNGFGMVDLHRASVVMRDGQDSCTQLPTQQIGPGASVSMALPASMAMTGGDFDLAFTIDNGGGQAFGSSQLLRITLSAIGGNTLQISQTGSNVQILGYIGGASTTFLNATNTGVAMPNGLLTVEISVHDNMLSVWLQGAATPAFEGPYPRAGGQFQPTIAYATGSGPANITITNYVNSSPMTVQPAITDAEMFGTNPSGPAVGASGANGGNAVNHSAGQAYETVHDLAIDTGNYCLLQAGRPTQAITAAATINPDAGLVALTGPASGSYAITLAAPRVQDQGRMMIIEMESTTSTNSVTMSLSTVTGSTGGTTTCTWNGANQQLVLIGGETYWGVVRQNNVTIG